MGCSSCCRRPLPWVRNLTQAETQEDFSLALDPLIDGLSEYSAHQLNILKARFAPMIDAADREKDRAYWWDSRLFMFGFLGSLLVTLVASVNLAGYISPSMQNIVGTVVVVVSSVGTAAMGLRERLKFKEAGDISKRLSSDLQRRGFLFIARAEPYASRDREAAYRKFIRHAETLKMRTDEEHLALQEEDDRREPDGHAPFSTLTPLNRVHTPEPAPLTLSVPGDTPAVAPVLAENRPGPTAGGPV